MEASRCIAWGVLDDTLSQDQAREACEKILHELLEEPLADIRHALTTSQPVPWSISNAYYDADVEHRWIDTGTNLSTVPAHVFFVNRASPLDVHRALVHRQGPGHEIPIPLILGIPTDTQARVDPLDVEELYAMEGWEYIDLATEPAVTERVRNALMVHMWPTQSHGAVPEELSQLDQMNQSIKSMPISPSKMPNAPVSMQHALEAFLDSDEDHADFGPFVTAPGATEKRAESSDADIPSLAGRFAAPTSPSMASEENEEPFPWLFETLRRQMEHVKSLPLGPQREEEAARVALAVQQALFQ